MSIHLRTALPWANAKQPPTKVSVWEETVPIVGLLVNRWAWADKPMKERGWWSPSLRHRSSLPSSSSFSSLERWAFLVGKLGMSLLLLAWLVGCFWLFSFRPWMMKRETIGKRQRIWEKKVSPLRLILLGLLFMKLGRARLPGQRSLTHSSVWIRDYLCPTKCL